MRHNTLGSICVKALIAIASIAFISACAGFGEEAPLSDGLFLSYDFGGSSIRVTFYEIDPGSFYVVVSSGDDFEDDPENIPDNRKTIVDKRLKKESGAVYEAGPLGPLWVAPSKIKQGANVYGDEIVAVREWEGWQVGVIRASFGRGALRGEWYYDAKTGFLVGGKRATVMNADEGGTVFVLDDSNLISLFE